MTITTLRDGTTVLAHAAGHAKTFANRTQAVAAQDAINATQPKDAYAEVIRRGRPWYVLIHVRPVDATGTPVSFCRCSGQGCGRCRG